MDTHKIAVIGLGYVGLPLSIAFAEKYKVKGFDINDKRIKDLNRGEDHTHEANAEKITDLLQAFRESDLEYGIFFTNSSQQLADCTIYIITVPTPVDKYNEPDLTLLKEATKTVASTLKKGDVVIYESTVYPGCTEEICVPVLEEYSGLRFNVDFFCGYSPERINPGDKTRTISQIRKITSGSTSETAKKVDELYASIITAGTYPAPSIKVAEAAKVIENTQRDINIAFVNELSKIFNLLGIDTQEVLKAAATKWNFLPFQPGLVGGHCIGIDPYYLADKAVAAGHQPGLILAARKINNSMGEYVAERVIRLMEQKKIDIPGAQILIMGITFKENFSDVRNSRVVDIVKALDNYKVSITIFDPVASPTMVKEIYGLKSYDVLNDVQKYSAIIIAVNHRQFATVNYSDLLLDPGVLFDVKGGVQNERINGRL
ncbi:MAG: UDP-N-acetyl-D-galactosamine dehydrogenase [Sediminibacterium sp.]|nr:UDP-N-acetyl-D-galactosamine dehydrogenase [Sediminibacterium sp.]